MSFATLPPYLVDQDQKKICSFCHEVFDPRKLPSLSKAFREHFMTKHRPGKKGKRYLPGLRSVLGEKDVRFQAFAHHVPLPATLHDEFLARKSPLR